MTTKKFASIVKRLTAKKNAQAPPSLSVDWTPWQYVKSSNVHSARYNSQERNLEVRFHGGRVYRYTNVPEGVFENFLNAPSKGRYLRHSIRTRFPAYRIG